MRKICPWYEFIYLLYSNNYMVVKGKLLHNMWFATMKSWYIFIPPKSYMGHQLHSSHLYSDECDLLSESFFTMLMKEQSLWKTEPNTDECTPPSSHSLGVRLVCCLRIAWNCHHKRREYEILKTTPPPPCHHHRALCDVCISEIILNAISAILNGKNSIVWELHWRGSAEGDRKCQQNRDVILRKNG